MKTLTSKEAFAMAKTARDFSNAIFDFRDRHIEELTAKESRELEKRALELVKLSNQFVAKAAEASLEVGDDFLEQLKGATKTMQAELKKLGEAKRALTMLASLIGLGTALVSLQPEAIGSALKEVVATATTTA